MPSSSQDKVRDSHAKVSIEEKLSLATEFKVTDQNIFVNWSEPHIKSHLQDKGNENYKSKDYKSAAGKYHRAILYMKVCKIFWNRLQANLCRASTMTSMAHRPSFRMLLLTLTTRNTSTLRWRWKSSIPFVSAILGRIIPEIILSESFFRWKSSVSRWISRSTTTWQPACYNSKTPRQRGSKRLQRWLLSWTLRTRRRGLGKY